MVIILISSWASKLGKSELRRKSWTKHGHFCSGVKESGLCLVLAYPWWWTWVIPALFPPKSSDKRRGSCRREAGLFPEEHISLYFSGWRRGVLGGGLLQTAEQFQMGRAVFSVQKSHGFPPILLAACSCLFLERSGFFVLSIVGCLIF